MVQGERLSYSNSLEKEWRNTKIKVSIELQGVQADSETWKLAKKELDSIYKFLLKNI